MLKTKYTVNLCMHINIRCICNKNTATYLKVGQQLLWLTLRVNPWLWNWALITLYLQQQSHTVVYNYM